MIMGCEGVVIRAGVRMARGVVPGWWDVTGEGRGRRVFVEGEECRRTIVSNTPPGYRTESEVTDG